MKALTLAEKQAKERLERKAQEREYRQVRKEIKRYPMACGSLTS